MTFNYFNGFSFDVFKFRKFSERRAASAGPFIQLTVSFNSGKLDDITDNCNKHVLPRYLKLVSCGFTQ